MASQFQLFMDSAGDWRWRLLAENHESIAASSEGYVARSDCEHGLSLTTKLSRDAPVREP